jgi:hypothetical protein
MTLLNDADKICLGSFNADAVYAGANKTWPPPRPFTPLDLPGLQVWLDASQLGLADGAPVHVWPNLGPGPQPRIDASLPLTVFKANAANGNGVVRFGVSGSRLRGSVNANFDYTIAYVTRRWGGNVGRSFSTQLPPTNILVGFHGSMQDICYDNGWLNAGTAWGDTGSLPAAWKLYGMDSASPSPPHSRFFVNGIVAGATTNSNGLGNAYALSGYDPGGIAETMDCDVAELLIYDHKLPDADRISVEDYLRSKWGVSPT